MHALTEHIEYKTTRWMT